MPARAEHLPMEIWLMIFHYLEAHDLFQSFNHLNSYFNQILTSDYLLFYLQLKESDNNHLQNPFNPYWSDVVLRRVICLQSNNQKEYDYFPQFLRWHAKKLTRLQSLSIKILIPNTRYVSIALRELNLLKYLCIKCIPNQLLLEAILAIPTLRTCHLLLRKTLIDMTYHSNINSNIKELFIVFYHNVNHSIINFLLSHMPILSRLEISGSYSQTDQVALFAEQQFRLPQLRILKLKLENGYFISSCFTCLHKIMPNLKYFYFNYYNHVLHRLFLDYFISHWWLIIEPIERIDIYINGHINIDTIDSDKMRTITEQHREFLLAKGNQSKGQIKVDWNKQALTELKLIEISIRKS